MCARGDGIRGSKDLRAEIGKFPNSTNERKQMSNKTMKQRIAMVAASALTAGFLSVVAMPAANAAAGDVTITTSTGVITAPAITGSVGTGTISLTGSVTFAAAVLASSVTELRISGGTFTSVASGAVINSDGTRAYQSAYGVAIDGLVAKPTTAGRNMVVTSYGGTSGTADGGTAAIAAAAAATGAVDTITITVAAAGVSGVYSASKSWFAIVDSASTGSSVTNADTTYANIINAGGTGVISYSLKDGLNNALASTAIVYATIKSGACVIGLATAPTAGTMVVGVSPTDLIYVAQADSTNTPAATCVVEIQVDGTLAATKTFIFQGPVASIEVTSLGRGVVGSAGSAAGYIVAKDSAGNAIGGVSISGDVVNSTDVAKVSSVGSATTARAASTVGGGTAPASTPSTVYWVCGAAGSEGTPIKFKTSNGTGGYIYSPEYKVSCGSSAVTYTASLDKASYLPGDIATLTITGKDSKGFLTNDNFVLASGSTGEVMSLSGSQLTLVGTTGTETFSGGSKTYKFVVGTTEGSYNLVVDLPKILTATNKALYGAATQTVAYKVSAGTASVSNAEVLKSIVALIASINKQIQALQALILKKK